MTNLVLYVVIAVIITILVARYVVPIFLKGFAIPGQIVPIVNVVLFVIIFALSFGGLRYVLSPAKDIERLAELEQLRQAQATAKQQQEAAKQQQEQEAQRQAELARAEQLRQEQAQQQLELERLNRDKAQRLAELEQLRQAQAAAEQQQQEQEAQRQAELARKQAAESLVRSYYEALNHDLRRQQAEVAGQAAALKRQQEETQRLAEEARRQAVTYKSPPVTGVPYSTSSSKRELLPPSFNCAKARTPTEIAICTNSLLADADGRLGRIYWALMHSLSKTNSQSLKKQQLEWLRQRDIRLENECSASSALDVGCALRLWEDRVTALESMRSKVP